MSTHDAEFMEQLRAAFQVEAAEHLQAISDGLLKLERCVDSAESPLILEGIFREAHSLKGAARAVDLADVEGVCQALESVFAAWKRGEQRPTDRAFDVAQQAADLVRELVAPEQPGDAAGHPSRVQATIRELEILLSDRTSAEGQVNPPAAQPETSPAAAGIPPPAVDRRPAAETVRIATGKLDAVLRQAEELLALKLISSQRLADLQQLQINLAARDREWRGFYPELRSAMQSLQKQAASLTGANSGLTSRILGFLNGNHAAFKDLVGQMTSLIRAADHDRRTLGSMVDHLLADAKKLLMLPFSTLLAIFPKLVRDLCREQGKSVDLSIQGGEVEIDKRVLEEIKAPLIHLVRNCIDHGLERPEVRVRQGKPAQGTLRIAISQVEGNKVEIAVCDDGQGIDLARLKSAAIEHGCLTEAKAQQLNDCEAMALIFESGISTSPLLTAISGRGLGLAIVREKVDRLAGCITVESQRGHGTTFRVQLPLTLATFRGTLIRAAEQEFIIPTADVERVLRFQPSQVKTVANQDTLVVDGRAVPLVRLDALLDLMATPRTSVALNYLSAVLLGTGEQRIAFLVDEILQEQEILVKSLGRWLARVRNVAGAAVLGSGIPVVILNAADLLKSARRSTNPGRREVASAGLPTPAKEQSILVVEDSITARMLLKNILESAGYRVRTAVDGVDAWTTLKTERFDLIVSDIQMPRLNGFDLTAKIRGDQTLAKLPVILVTALASPEDRERGIDVGANAYIVKRDFDQSDLLEVVHRLL